MKRQLTLTLLSEISSALKANFSGGSVVFRCERRAAMEMADAN